MKGEIPIAPVENNPEKRRDREQVKGICPPDSSHHVAIHVRPCDAISIREQQAEVSEKLLGG
jgi:hypothetical protein